MKRLSDRINAAAAVLAIGASSVASGPPRLIWNASASVPVGLYAVRPVERFAIADLVLFDAPKPVVGLMAERGYLPAGVHLLKEVAALPPQTVCRSGRRISVDGVERGAALERDSHGRSLPAWEGCHRLRAGELFVMNGSVPDSFDGRYFGPIASASVIGRAVPLWTDPHGTERFEWQGAVP